MKLETTYRIGVYVGRALFGLAVAGAVGAAVWTAWQMLGG